MSPDERFAYIRYLCSRARISTGDLAGITGRSYHTCRYVWRGERKSRPIALITVAELGPKAMRVFAGDGYDLEKQKEDE